MYFVILPICSLPHASFLCYCCKASYLPSLHEFRFLSCKYNNVSVSYLSRNPCQLQRIPFRLVSEVDDTHISIFFFFASFRLQCSWIHSLWTEHCLALLLQYTLCERNTSWRCYCNTQSVKRTLPGAFTAVHTLWTEHFLALLLQYTVCEQNTSWRCYCNKWHKFKPTFYIDSLVV